MFSEKVRLYKLDVSKVSITVFDGLAMPAWRLKARCHLWRARVRICQAANEGVQQGETCQWLQMQLQHRPAGRLTVSNACRRLSPPCWASGHELLGTSCWSSMVLNISTTSRHCDGSGLEFRYSQAGVSWQLRHVKQEPTALGA